MRILIAGGKGYIGSHLFSQLKGINSVTIIDYNGSATKINSIDLNLTDINQINDFANNCDRFDILIFLVGLAHSKGKGKDLPEFIKMNYQTLVNLISALAENNRIPDKIIFSSTISVYGEKYKQTIYSEDSDCKPYSAYAVTKLAAEKYLLDNFNTKSWILRLAPVYSSDFLLNINRRTKIRSIFYRIGKGSKNLSLCNIENIGVAVEAIINNKVPNGVYNISDNINYTYDDLLRWQKANLIFPIPMFVIKLLYYLGKFVNNTFLRENTVKLITNNIFPPDKICSHIDLPATINDVKFNHD